MQTTSLQTARRLFIQRQRLNDSDPVNDAAGILDVVRDLPIPPFVLYQLDVLPGARSRLVRALIDALRADPAAKVDRAAALTRSRARVELRTAGAEANAG